MNEEKKYPNQRDKHCIKPGVITCCSVHLKRMFVIRITQTNGSCLHTLPIKLTKLEQLLTTTIL